MNARARLCENETWRMKIQNSADIFQGVAKFLGVGMRFFDCGNFETKITIIS